MAISYGYCYTIAIASECSAAAVLVSYWTDLTPAVVITISLVLILWINLMSVRFFGETEVVTGGIKVLCFLGLVIVAIVITAGGGPNHKSIGFKYWNNPGAWVDYNGITGSTGHFLGFLSAFVNASFSFVGVETVVITAAESVNPHKAIPKAANRVTYRIGFFYVLGALLIGLIVDPRNADLVSGSGNAKSSPWVIAIQTAGIKVLPSIVNACILVSAWSAGNSYCWVGSRMILAMTTDRQLPQFFARTTSKGVPYVAVITAWLFGPLAYLSKSLLSYSSLNVVLIITRSWFWWRCSGFLLASQPQHSCRPHRMGNSLLLLHPLLSRHEGSRHRPQHPPLEGALAALHRVVWRYWLHRHHPRRWIPCLPQG